MGVMIYAQDLSGRSDHGCFSMPDLNSALEIFFGPETGVNTLDSDGDELINRADAFAKFEAERRISFYNQNGENVVITADFNA